LSNCWLPHYLGFTDGAEFQTWLLTDNSKLWINGIRRFFEFTLRLGWNLSVAGAGKTILMWAILKSLSPFR
jgi:hypothetical protein